MSPRSFIFFARFDRRRCAALFVSLFLVAGCAAPRASATPTRVDVLATGFLVDNTVLATTEELRAFLADSGARDVRLHATKDIAPDRIARAATAVRDSGAAVEILVAPAAPAR